VIDAVRKLAPAVAVTIASVLLAACGGGDGSVGVGQGQQPDPAAPDFAIAYTKARCSTRTWRCSRSTDLRNLQRCNIGTDLYLRARASATAAEKNLTTAKPKGWATFRASRSRSTQEDPFRDRGPCDPGADDEDQPTWKIWEYDLPTDKLRRIIESTSKPKRATTLSPHYLPDGRIIFASTRQAQSKAILLDEASRSSRRWTRTATVPRSSARHGSRRQQPPPGVVHQSNDYDPVVLDDGKIMFSRWTTPAASTAFIYIR